MPLKSARATVWVNHIEEGAMALFLALMTLFTFVQVVLRYLFNTGLVWSLEATTYCFSWLVLIGMSHAVRTGGHIAANVLVSRFDGTVRMAMGLAATVLCLIYAGAMLWGSVVLFDRLFALGNNARDLPVPRWLLTVILPIGFGLLIYRLLEVIWKIFKGERLGPSGDELASLKGELDLLEDGEARQP